MSTEMIPFENPIFDCNAALGRRHDRRVEGGESTTLMNLMMAAHISRAIVYNPYGIHFGTSEGNRFLLDDINKNSVLIPQFVVNLAIESPSDVPDIERASSVRIFPATHKYPLAAWVVDAWFAWLGQEKKPVYIPMGRYPEVCLDDQFGYVGCVMEGAVRDSDDLRRMNFQVYCRSAHPEYVSGLLLGVSMNEPVSVGGVTIAADDIVVGDNDGVAVIPSGTVEQVLKAADAILLNERQILNEIAEGSPTLRSYGEGSPKRFKKSKSPFSAAMQRRFTIRSIPSAELINR